MSRSRVLVAALATLFLALGASPVLAQSTGLLDAIATVDFARGPSVVQVGSWARYRMKGHSDTGAVDDYVITVLIAGEEEFWGDDCFWVETWTQAPNGPVRPAATLLSRSVFEDSLPTRHVLLYQRKRIEENDDNGVPLQQIMRRGSSAIKSRTPPDIGLSQKIDTLGTDTVQTTASGIRTCLKVRVEEGVSSIAQSADSSQYTEVRDIRTKYFDHAVPVTGLAREDIDYSIARRTWLVGRSRESTPMRTMDHAVGRIELVDFGTGGVTPVLVPEAFRHSLAEQRLLAAKSSASAKAPPARRATARAKAATKR